jgi:hypothetical protein
LQADSESEPDLEAITNKIVLGASP